MLCGHGSSGSRVAVDIQRSPTERPIDVPLMRFQIHSSGAAYISLFRFANSIIQTWESMDLRVICLFIPISSGRTRETPQTIRFKSDLIVSP